MFQQSCCTVCAAGTETLVCPLLYPRQAQRDFLTQGMLERRPKRDVISSLTIRRSTLFILSRKGRNAATRHPAWDCRSHPRPSHSQPTFPGRGLHVWVLRQELDMGAVVAGPSDVEVRGCRQKAPLLSSIGQ